MSRSARPGKSAEKWDGEKTEHVFSLYLRGSVSSAMIVEHLNVVGDDRPGLLMEARRSARLASAHISSTVVMTVIFWWIPFQKAAPVWTEIVSVTIWSVSFFGSLFLAARSLRDRRICLRKAKDALVREVMET